MADKIKNWPFEEIELFTLSAVESILVSSEPEQRKFIMQKILGIMKMIGLQRYEDMEDYISSRKEYIDRLEEH